MQSQTRCNRMDHLPLLIFVFFCKKKKKNQIGFWFLVFLNTFKFTQLNKIVLVIKKIVLVKKTEKYIFLINLCFVTFKLYS